MNRKQTYAALRAAGFSRDFARRHDRAPETAVQLLVRDVSSFERIGVPAPRAVERASELADVRAAARGSARAKRLVTERGHAAPPRRPRPRDIPWYGRTSDLITETVKGLKPELSTPEYAELQGQVRRVRTLLARKALDGPKALTLDEYAETRELFYLLFPEDVSWSELYGSEEDGST